MESKDYMSQCGNCFAIRLSRDAVFVGQIRPDSDCRILKTGLDSFFEHLDLIDMYN